MQLSETIKLYMTKEQKNLIVMAMNGYISTVNSLVSVATNGTSISKYTTADNRDNCYENFYKVQCPHSSFSISIIIKK